VWQKVGVALVVVMAVVVRSYGGDTCVGDGGKLQPLKLKVCLQGWWRAMVEAVIIVMVLELSWPSVMVAVCREV